MRHIRALHLTARHTPPLAQCVAPSRRAGVLGAVMVVLVALAWPASAPIQPGAADPPVRSVVSGSLEVFQLAVLPVGDPDGGVVTADRPNPAPTAVHALTAPALTASRQRQQRSQPPASRPARRHSHHAAGSPRAPPASPRSR